MVAPVEGHSIARQNPPHHMGNRILARPEKKMSMIAKQRPRIAGSGGFQQDTAKPSEKGLPIRIIPVNRPSFDSTNDDVVERPRGVYS